MIHPVQATNAFFNLSTFVDRNLNRATCSITLLGLLTSIGLRRQRPVPNLDVASTVPAIGTDVPMHRGAFTTVPAGGMGVLHDFSTIVETGASTYRWTATSISPNAGMFPTANLALNNGGPDTIFYKTSALGFERVGETRTIDVLLAKLPRRLH